MTDPKAASAALVTLPAWSIHLVPAEHPRPWRLNVIAAGMQAPAVQLDRVAVHLTEAEIGALAETLLCPRHSDEPRPARARVLRDGGGPLRVVVDAVDDDPNLVAHIEEYHRVGLLDDISWRLPHLMPASAPAEPTLRLDPIPVTGLAIDQVVELHRRLGHWLESEGIRAVRADRFVREKFGIPTR
ncbi:hypothetical protein OG948_21180 [Embleya sp. NBC_00888]|uniref:hypothetical protein n=1 Tax=Embleya sp. NBC_00888 TaxID=2975960 RepID=UPI00386D04CD|nr:hypothetical protein OG948_21180 [Embleya sp. NBC_00888]